MEERTILRNWVNPNSRYKEFYEPPESEGVYCFLITFDDEDKPGHLGIEVLYIGRSNNLKNRIESHETLRILKIVHTNLSIYFQECINSNSIEKKLIKSIKPRYNKQFNGS